MPDGNHKPRIAAGGPAIIRVSTNAAGEQANSYSFQPVFSPDGTKVAFDSWASNLITSSSPDDLASGNTYLKDLITGAVTLISNQPGYPDLGSSASVEPVFSLDGGKIGFVSNDNFGFDGDWTATDLFIKDLTTGVLTRVTKGSSETSGNGDAGGMAFSPDGTKVAFRSFASNLVSGDTNATEDVFVKDLTTGVFTRVSTGSAGEQGNGWSGYGSAPSFSPDGGSLTFASLASNLVSGDTNGQSDIFVKNLTTGAMRRVSTDAAGAQANGASYAPVFSPDGRKVAFASSARNLVSGDTNGKDDIFIKDLTTGSVIRVSIDASGAQANGDSFGLAFSPDGSQLAFYSQASNLTNDDTNGAADIFVKDLTSGAVVRVAANKSSGINMFMPVVFSPDGNRLVFESNAAGLVDGDTNGEIDIFVATLHPQVFIGAVTEDGFATASGTFGFTDVDTGDAHTVSVAAAADGTLGTLSAVLSHDTTGTGSGGEVTWSYAVHNAAIQYLKAGQTKVESFTVRVSDGADTTEQAVAVTVTGVNDAPALTGTAAVLADGLKDHVYSVTTAQLLQGWADADEDDLSVVDMHADHGTISYDAVSIYSLTPDAGYVGPVALSYKVRDPHIAVTASLSVALAGNHAPQIGAGRPLISLATTNAAGKQGNGQSTGPSYSPDGTKIAFSSDASNLVGGDTNDGTDIFVKDLVTGTIQRVSTGFHGGTGLTYYGGQVMSADGTKIIFQSSSSDLASGDSNGQDDIFVKDLTTGVITRVSTDADGGEGNDWSRSAAFSPDGTKVVFWSAASNLVAGDTNHGMDLFVKDLTTGAISRVSTDATGAQDNEPAFSLSPYSGGILPFNANISQDGTRVVFASHASNLVAGDTNNRWDVFVKDLVTGAIIRVSTTATGGQVDESWGNEFFHPVFSPDGSKVAFESMANHLVDGDTDGQYDVFVKDLVTGAITLISGNGSGAEGSYAPVFSPDGTKVAFESVDRYLEGKTYSDIFIKDLLTGAITRVSQGNGDVNGGRFSPDGSSVIFSSSSTNLVDGDTNGVRDIFIASLDGTKITVDQKEAGTVSARGAFGFSDVDTADTHVVSVTATSDDTLGTLATYLHDTTGSGTGGEIAWVYSVDSALIQSLKADEAKVETFKVTVSDGVDTAEQTISITIKGINHAPKLAGSVANLPRGVEDVAYSVTRADLLQGWADDEGDLLSVIDIHATHGTMSYDAGSDSYRLVPEAGYSGPVIVSYKVTDLYSEVAASLTLVLSAKYVTSGETTTLQPGEKRLLLTGWHSINGTGNDLDNVLIGNGGNNVLTGLGGDDLLDGRKGGDRMVGGTGDDTYSVDSAGDVVVELADQGSDTAKTVVDGYVLSANVERLILAGAADIDGSGNGLDNVVFGNGGDNGLSGGDGNDSLFGGKGADTLSGDAGRDLLDGGAGSDSLAGGAGNDSYIVDTFDDLVSELAGGGSDTVKTNLDGYRLGAYVENLILTGTAAIDGGGNTLNNVVIGNGGDNNLAGYGGRDRLVGGRGNDRLDGGTGADAMYGGLGNDTYSVENAGDRVFEGVGEGRDTVKTNLDGYVLSAHVEDLILTGSGNISGMGNDLNNVIHGNGADNRLGGANGNDRLAGGKGSDTLDGGAGNDFLDGGVGADSMAGGMGDDTYGVDAFGDHIRERDGEGIDTVKTALDGYALAKFVENLVLMGTEAINGTGNALNNVITGNGADNRLKGSSGDDRLVGGGGNDRLDGGTGADRMSGGAGDDTYIVDDAGDAAIERGGEGMDTVRSKVDGYALGSNVEYLILGGTADIGGYGNFSDNVLTGNDGNNALFGRDGNDTLYGGKGNDRLDGAAGNDVFDGGTGADTLFGGAGNDTYYVGVGDVVFEGAGGGTDLVISTLASYQLGQNLEDVTLYGVRAMNAVGNALKNIMTGNANGNVLQGGDGRDTIDGMAGEDTLAGGAGGDLLTGGAGTDVFVYAALSDSLVTATDYISDLSAGDKIDLSLIDADVVAGGDQAFHRVNAFTHHAAEMVIRYDAGTNQTSLSLDRDGDGVAEFMVLMAGSHTDPVGWML